MGVEVENDTDPVFVSQAAHRRHMISSHLSVIFRYCVFSHSDTLVANKSVMKSIFGVLKSISVACIIIQSLGTGCLVDVLIGYVNRCRFACFILRLDDEDT